MRGKCEIQAYSRENFDKPVCNLLLPKHFLRLLHPPEDRAGGGGGGGRIRGRPRALGPGDPGRELRHGPPGAPAQDGAVAPRQQRRERQAGLAPAAEVLDLEKRNNKLEKLPIEISRQGNNYGNLTILRKESLQSLF